MSHSIRTERGPASWLMDAPHMTLPEVGTSPQLTEPKQKAYFKLHLNEQRA